MSQSADLSRLGLVERHLRLALGEVARVVIRAGHSLVYGGHLDQNGYTAFLESEMDRYGRTDRPLHLIVGWSEHRRLSLTELRRHKESLGLNARITYLDAAGVPVSYNADRGEDPEPAEDVPGTLTALRRYLVKETDARVFIGGKEHGYQGEMPGIVQEAALAIDAGQPSYFVGGFGGATATIAALVAALRSAGRLRSLMRTFSLFETLLSAHVGPSTTTDLPRRRIVCLRQHTVRAKSPRSSRSA